jgi:ribosomal protein S27AE
MAEGDSRSERARKAARTRAACPRCGNGNIIEKDGAQVQDGVLGITYRCCLSCGWTQAKTKKQRPKKW